MKMHSKIIQVSRTPLVFDDYVEEDAFYDNFACWIADYVDDDVCPEVRKDVIDGFIHMFGSDITTEWDENDGTSFIVAEGWKDVFAAQRLQYAREYLARATVDDMKTGNVVYELEKYLGDPFGVYIYENGCLTMLVRWLCERMREGVRYYFGAVVDYHY